MQSLTIERQVHFTRGRHTRKVIQDGPPPDPAPMPEGTIPRISRLMALAIRFDQLIKEGDWSQATYYQRGYWCNFLVEMQLTGEIRNIF